MNFLELSQALVREGGISGTLTSVSGQVGEMGRVVNWINTAYRYILNSQKHWRFLRKEITFYAIAGATEYPTISLGLADFGEWKLDDVRAYAQAIGIADEQRVTHACDYDDFRRKYRIGTMRIQTGRPLIAVERPDQALVLWPVPDAAYSVMAEYYRAPPALLTNSDTPALPARFHEAIVYRALMLYAEFEGDASLFASAQSEFSRWLSQIERSNLPSFSAGGPMA